KKCRIDGHFLAGPLPGIGPRKRIGSSQEASEPGGPFWRARRLASPGERLRYPLDAVEDRPEAAPEGDRDPAEAALLSPSLEGEERHGWYASTVTKPSRCKHSRTASVVANGSPLSLS